MEDNCWKTARLIWEIFLCVCNSQDNVGMKEKFKNLFGKLENSGKPVFFYGYRILHLSGKLVGL